MIALVIVGPQRLPELGRTIGKGLREFRKMQDEVKDMVNTGMGEELKQTRAPSSSGPPSDLKSATDVRSAFRTDTQRHRATAVAADEARRHGPRQTPDDRRRPEPDARGRPDPARPDVDDADDPGAAE